MGTLDTDTSHECLLIDCIDISIFLNLTFKSESNVTPFGIACRRGHIEIMTLLLNSGIDPLSGVKDAFLKDDIDVFKVLYIILNK